MHEEYLVHPHFHRANIQVACSIEDFLTICETSANNSNSNSDGPEKGMRDDEEEDDIGNNAYFEVADDIAVIHDKGEGDDEEENVIENNADSEVANDIAVNREKGVGEEKGAGDDEGANEIYYNANSKDANNIGPVTNTTTKRKWDWHEIGMCVMIGIDAVDKCQDSVGRCKNYIHHLCQMIYVEKSGLPESRSLAKLCRAHCPKYFQITDGAKAKSPPENMVSIAAVNVMKHSTAAWSSTTTAGATAPILPSFASFKETHWTCPKCHIELLVTTK
jgi:hypothetical protein